METFGRSIFAVVFFSAVLLGPAPVRADDDQGVPSPVVDREFDGPNEDPSLNVGPKDGRVYVGSQQSCIYAYDWTPGQCPIDTNLVCGSGGDYCVDPRDVTPTAEPLTDIPCMYETADQVLFKCGIPEATGPCFDPICGVIRAVGETPCTTGTPVPREVWKYPGKGESVTNVALGPCVSPSGEEYPCLFNGYKAGKVMLGVRLEEKSAEGACQWARSAADSIQSSPVVWRKPAGTGVGAGEAFVLAGTDADHLVAWNAGNGVLAGTSRDLGGDVRMDPLVFSHDGRDYAMVGNDGGGTSGQTIELVDLFDLIDPPPAPTPAPIAHQVVAPVSSPVVQHVEKGGALHPDGDAAYLSVGADGGAGWVGAVEVAATPGPPSLSSALAFPESVNDHNRTKPVFSTDGETVYKTVRTPQGAEGPLEAYYTHTSPSWQTGDCKWRIPFKDDVLTVNDGLKPIHAMTSTPSVTQISCGRLLGDQPGEGREVWDWNAQALQEITPSTCAACQDSDDVVDLILVGEKNPTGVFMAVLDCGAYDDAPPVGASCRDSGAAGPPVLWARKLGGQIRATPAVSADGATVYAKVEAGSDHDLWALDLMTGAVRWFVNAGGDPECSSSTSSWRTQSCFHGPDMKSQGLADSTVTSGPITGHVKAEWSAAKVNGPGACGYWVNRSILGDDVAPPTPCGESCDGYMCGELNCTQSEGWVQPCVGAGPAQRECNCAYEIPVREGTNDIEFNIVLPLQNSALWTGERTATGTKEVLCQPGPNDDCATGLDPVVEEYHSCNVGDVSYACEVHCSGSGFCVASDANGDGRAVVCGTSGLDIVVGAAGVSNVVCGFDGDDTILGSGDGDFLVGGRGDDTIIAWPGAGNVVLGGPGDDNLYANGNCNTPGAKDVHLCGGEGDNDELFGCGAGHACLDAGPGANDECSNLEPGTNLTSGRGCETLVGTFDGDVPCGCPS